MANQTSGNNQSSAFAGFDSLRILDSEINITAGGENYIFETEKDADGQIISVNCDRKNREVTYE